jgi:hypothetical protein
LGFRDLGACADAVRAWCPDGARALVLGVLLPIVLASGADSLSSITEGPDRLANNLRTWFHDWAAEEFFRAVQLTD